MKGAKAEIHNPDIPVNSAELGLIYGSKIDDHTGAASVTMMETVRLKTGFN